MKLGKQEEPKGRSVKPRMWNASIATGKVTIHPQCALLYREKVDYRGQMSVTRCPVVTRPGVVRSGTVEGHAVDNILLDTGCSRTLVHKKLVPEGMQRL